MTPEDWVQEALHRDYGQALRVDRVLYDSGTPHQRLRLFENGRFGRVMTLDGVVQVTEGDEFIYHEMMAHVPILAHGAVTRVLIIGGGDGGLAREVLRHPGISDLTMVELDAEVVAFSRHHLPHISAGAFLDPRLALVISDGAAYVARTAERFDVIMVDSTDPDGPGKVLFTPGFYADCKRCLTPGGILVTQNGVPFLQPDALTTSIRALRPLFADAGCYLTHVPTYAGGPMALGWATDGAHRATGVEVIARRFAAAGFDTRCYTPDLHVAAFALPRYILRLIA